VIAPHPDDEVLGVGGTISRRKASGGEVAWLVATCISEEDGWPAERVDKRKREIEEIAQLFNFDEVHTLNFPTARLDQIPFGQLVGKISTAFQAFEPEEVFVPHYGDVHSDHRLIFDAVASCVKWFRYPSVKRVLAYETLSETDFGILPTAAFKPNYFVDIAGHLDRKLRAMQVYQSELGEHPFPRSLDAIKALATLRGAMSGYKFAEAFEMLRERE
jgi:LmbE family N-acetylglucosaminyl deacetylase